MALRREILIRSRDVADYFIDGNPEKMAEFAGQSVQGVVHFLMNKYQDPAVRQFCGNLDAALATYSGRLVAPTDEQSDGSILHLSGNYRTDSRVGIQCKVAVWRRHLEIVKVDIGKDRDLQLQLVISTILKKQYASMNPTDTAYSLTHPTNGWNLELSNVGAIEVPQGSNRWYDCFAGHTYDFELVTGTGTA